MTTMLEPVVLDNDDGVEEVALALAALVDDAT